MAESMWGVVGAVIVAIVSLVGTIYQSRKANDALIAKLDKQSELADERIKGEINVIRTEISDLKKQVERHNSVIERTYKVEESAALHEAEFKRVNHRLDELEKVNIISAK